MTGEAQGQLDLFAEVRTYPPHGTMRTAPELCPGMGHPGVTFNPRESRTWCLCGERTYEGEPATVGEHLACCGGPLMVPVKP